MLVKTTTVNEDNQVTTTTTELNEEQGKQAMNEAIEDAGIGSTITQSWLVGHTEIQVCKCEIWDNGVSVCEQVRWIHTMEDKAIVIG